MYIQFKNICPNKNVYDPRPAGDHFFCMMGLGLVLNMNFLSTTLTTFHCLSFSLLLVITAKGLSSGITLPAGSGQIRRR